MSAIEEGVAGGLAQPGHDEDPAFELQVPWQVEAAPFTSGSEAGPDLRAIRAAIAAFACFVDDAGDRADLPTGGESRTS